MLASLLLLAVRSECLVDRTRAAGSIDDNELVGAFEFESADWGDCAGEAPFVFTSKLFDVPELAFPCPAEELFVDS